VRRIGAALLALVAATTLAGCGQAEAGQATTVDWRTCPGAPADYPVRCAIVTVPLDWTNGQGRVNLRVARLSAAGPAKRIGTLMFNPGGPGTGAVGYLSRPEYANQYFGKSILDRFDVVAVDPRGVGGSQGIDCALPANDPAMDRFPGDVAGVRVLTEANAAFAKSCRERSGPLAEHLDTVSVARDLDAVRAALGERQISFLGVSYGTMVGRAYAELFPQRLRALALDAIVDRSLPASRLVIDDAKAVQDGVDQFARWCTAQVSCGMDVPKVLSEVLATADRGELKAGQTTVTTREVQMGVNAFLQSPLLYSELANALRAAQQKDGTTLHETGMNSDPAAYRMYRSIICQDLGTEEFTAHLPELGRRVRELAPALRGYSEFWDIASGCAGWPVPAGWQPHPWPHSPGLPPTLLVSGAHDVATPRPWAENTHRQLPNSMLLRWDGTGHSAWQMNNACAREATVDYLITRELPAEGTVC
jgi:pimeloyl-ACP methyl ester carboxylesterase